MERIRPDPAFRFLMSFPPTMSLEVVGRLMVTSLAAGSRVSASVEPAVEPIWSVGPDEVMVIGTVAPALKMSVPTERFAVIETTIPAGGGADAKAAKVAASELFMGGAAFQLLAVDQVPLPPNVHVADAPHAEPPSAAAERQDQTTTA